MKVLVVEDNTDFREYIVDVIKTEFDVSIDSAENGDEAIALCRRTIYDLIVSDIDMPHTSGTETIARLRSSCFLAPHCQVIFLSGKLQNHLLDATGEGLFILDKPIEPQSLISKVKLSLGIASKKKAA
ncbi:MAG: response regulator [Bacteriovoracaceae bacterium]